GGVRWRFPEIALGPAGVAVDVEALPPAYQAVLVGKKPTPLEVTTSPPAGAGAVSVPGRVRYLSVPVGDRTAPVAMVRGAGERLTLLVDRNGNGVLGESGEVLPVPVAGREAGALYWQADRVPLGSREGSLAVQEQVGRATGRFAPAGARRGLVTCGGRTFWLHLLDADLDGTFDSAGDLWWFGPVEALKTVRKLVPEAMVEAGGPVFLDGASWRLMAVDSEGRAVVLRDEKTADVDAYFTRRAERVNRERWWPILRQEAAAFRREQGIDPSRPRAA
ncbi:MAG: hypothetical protein ACC662_07130, partial [Planctomycetota bacterium]